MSLLKPKNTTTPCKDQWKGKKKNIELAIRAETISRLIDPKNK